MIVDTGLRKSHPILFGAPMIRALLDGSKTQTRRLMRLKEGVASGIESAMTHGGQWTGTEGGYGGLVANVAGGTFSVPLRCPYGAVGDRLWVRETWAHANEGSPDPFVVYRSDRGARNLTGQRAGVTYWMASDYEPDRWRPSIFMPRWASRITLEITDVRVQRLQEISEADAIAEGVVWSEPTEADREWMRGRAEEEGSDVRDLDGVWLAPGTRQCYGPPHLRNEPRWAPTARGAYRWLWEAINGDGSWDANPWVWALTFRRVTP